ncbi:macrophage mannose receptor 1-like [Anneissia japonica]|uniref:macrophage mannose receptor 1-like n=1 Tax=Anneissia japonica TaxID=1529436 RepID=UPI001425552C|nr:macrophage mannose receptor 1-like [Anneissia japonica]
MDLEILSLVFILCGIKLERSVAQIPDSKGTLSSASPDNRIDCRYPILEQPIVSGKAKVLYKCCDGWGKTHGRDAKCVRQHCPVGFKRGYNDGCYKFVTSSTSWHEARNACQMTSEQSIKTRVSSDLVVIDSKEEEIFITREIHATGMSAAWIGLREVSVDGPLIWVNGSPLDALRQNFKHGEPNENTDTSDSCISIVNSTDDNAMKWEDRRCSNLKGYICEVRRACPPGYSQKFDSNCYKFVLDEPKDWYSARMDCKRHNFGDLLTFDQPLEIQYYNSAETLAAPRAWPMVFIGRQLRCW